MRPLVLALLAEPRPPMPAPLVAALGISCAAFVLVVGGLVLLWFQPWNRRAHYVAWSGVALGALSIGIRFVVFATSAPL